MARQGPGAMLASGGLGFPPQNLARVVVWEWLNEHGRWRPYSAAVCHHIENVLKEDARGSVVLGQVDVQLAPYVIDLQSMHQFRQDTGTMRPVRRNFYDPSSAPGKGIVWEWENDNNSWTPYDMDICITIQNAYEKQHPWLDLSSLGFCYLIYFSSMSQMNRQTQRKRRLRRRMDLAYPLTMGSIPKSQSWPVGTSTGTPCSCPQCLLVNSTRAASNAILASQRRKLYPGAVRQSSTFAGGALWPAGPGLAAGAGGTAKGEGLRVTSGGFAPGQSVPSAALAGLNNLNRPGTQRGAGLGARATVPPGSHLTHPHRQVLKLLIVAWDRRLIFTIGTSNTTGESDTVVWNEIHHKTEFGSNLTGHGYPDPNYLDNVLAELLAQGVSEATLKD
ncbi:deltex E3 ubiquitin ligase 1 [Willisornis vidua]|uniref:E3 ubiquitin-protein ligase n=1 Tax=Willisornis vidua TaxID=1566151 RepID=A0ABQ9DM54_9PASS|nr:deltex E3 ubiquitin ligase 1 [Willisornis vidua]